MKEYKGKLTTKLFWSVCGVCAGWFVYNLIGRMTHSLFLAALSGLIIIIVFLFKVFYYDNISLGFTDDKKLIIKRLGKTIKILDIDKYDWSEYSKYSSTKNVEDQDIYFVNKVTGEQESIDATNFCVSDYEEILELLGAKNTNTEPIKVETKRKEV